MASFFCDKLQTKSLLNKFTVHLATALALLIPATTSSSTLSYKSFLAVWLLSSIVATGIAGRYRLVTFLFLGVSGGWV